MFAEKMNQDEYIRHLELIARAVADYIFTVFVDSRGTPVKTLHSPSCLEVTGYHQDEFLSDSMLWIKMVHPEDRQAVSQYTATLSSDTHKKSMAHRIIRKDGTVRWVRNTMVPRVDETGGLTAYEGAVHDITDEKAEKNRLIQAEKKYRNLVNNLSVGVYRMRLSPKPKFMDSNPAFYTMFGYNSAEEIQRIADTEMFHTILDRNDLLEQLDKKGGIKATELRLNRADGSEIWVSLTASKQHDTETGQDYVEGILEDITERKKADMLLKSFNEELQKQIREKTAELLEVNHHMEKEIAERQKAERAVEKERERLFGILDGLPATVCLIDQDYAFVFSNKMFRKAFGDTFNKSCYEVIKGYDKPCNRCSYKSLFKTQSLLTHEEKLADGKTYQLHAYPFVDGDGNKLYLQLGIDITPLKQLEESLSFTSTVNAAFANLSHDILKLSDIRDISEKMLETAQNLTKSRYGFTGYIDTETGFLVCPTFERTIWDKCRVVHKDMVFNNFTGLWGWVLSNRKTLMTNDATADPRSSGTPQGHVEIDKFLGSPALIDGETAGMIAVASPEKNYTELDMLLLNRLATLYSIVITKKRYEDALLRTKEEAETANRAKSEFLATMSHELRTPLNSVIGFSEVLTNQHFGQLNDKQLRYVDNILTSGKHLLNLINDILDLSKIEAGKITLELTHFSLEKTLEESLYLINEKAYNKNISVDLKKSDNISELQIYADQTKIKQVIYNLLSNALKFTPDNGHITLSANIAGKEFLTGKTVGFHPQSGITKYAVLSVKDTGIGIDARDIERIFKEFEQVDSSYTRKYEGSGLGLSISKKIVELHEGFIWAESTGQDGGSTFSFALPLTGEEHP